MRLVKVKHHFFTVLQFFHKIGGLGWTLTTVKEFCKLLPNSLGYQTIKNCSYRISWVHRFVNRYLLVYVSTTHIDVWLSILLMPFQIQYPVHTFHFRSTCVFRFLVSCQETLCIGFYLACTISSYDQEDFTGDNYSQTAVQPYRSTFYTPSPEGIEPREMCLSQSCAFIAMKLESRIGFAPI